jgi:DNA-binding Lrp family transcriptional regulator
MIPDRLFKHWTEEEDRVLLQQAATVPLKELALRLGRTYSSVQQRLAKLRQQERQGHSGNGNGVHAPEETLLELKGEPDGLAVELEAMRAVAEALAPLGTAV